ncbi:sensor histidine kinase [Pseudonocardia sp. TRM90224]|uniref:sensor histidine kinase n=1 Tax=Pseudonocardia sp. TRM90224 TaxID=2812678 RepID=UPI001E2FB762|nr:sensor histidine kinase [Pseudonocardia sp. TRM90224]
MPGAQIPWHAPVRLLRSGRPLRGLGYLASGAVCDLLCLAALLVAVAAGLALSPFLAGFPLLVALFLVAGGHAALERRRVAWLGTPVESAEHRAPSRPGVTAWVGARLRDPRTRRELAHAVLSCTVLWPFELIVTVSCVLMTGFPLLAPLLAALFPAAFPAAVELAVAGWLWLAPPIGLLFALLSAYVLTAAAGVRARLTVVVLGARSDACTAEFEEVSRSRTRIVDRFDTERARIERDLHDGVQGRLLGLAVQLGIARSRLPATAATAPVAALLAGAHEEATTVLAELRRVVDGIHPHVLTDRGLVAAVDELAGTSTVPVRADLVLPGRLGRSVEACAYYVISEAITNAAKHSMARTVDVAARVGGGRLRVEIGDDGLGGASAVDGGGLQGLADRAAAVGGTLRLASPAGGPTRLVLEVPCQV